MTVSTVHMSEPAHDASSVICKTCYAVVSITTVTVFSEREEVETRQVAVRDR